MPYDKDLEKYLKEYQESPYSRVFAPLAEAYRRSGMSKEAVEICLEGIKHHPDFVSGKVSLARAYIDLKEFKKARGILEEVVEEAPENYMAQNLLAETYQNLNNLDDALRVYTYLLSLNPGDDNAKEAVKTLEAALEEKDIEPDKTQETKENLESEYEDLEEFPKLDIPPHPYDLIPEFDLTSFEMISGEDFEIKQAEDIFKEEDNSDIDITDDIATESMAELLEEQGHKDKALEIYRKLLAKDKDNTNLLSKITEIELEIGVVKVGDDDEAKEQKEGFDNTEDAMKYVYGTEDEGTSITVIPPSFNPSDINTDLENFESKDLEKLTESTEIEEELEADESSELTDEEEQEQEDTIDTKSDIEEELELKAAPIKNEPEEIPAPDIKVTAKKASKDEWLISDDKLSKLENLLNKIQKRQKEL